MADESSWLDDFPDEWFSNFDVGVAGLSNDEAEVGGAVLLHPRFAAPKTEEEVIAARKASVPEKTQLNTKYCIKVWHDWRK